MQNPLKKLSRGEVALWSISACTVLLSYLLSPVQNLYNLLASLIGVTALIFVAKGMVLGQILTVIFSVFYGTISFFFGYYGEMITYLCMTTPIAIMSVISWLKNPYGDTDEVTVSRMTRRQTARMILLAMMITVAFYFILRKIGNANLLFSTLSIATSFMASYMTVMRSPYYALGYAANDVVLIVLWAQASAVSLSYLPMVLCFIMFLANDLYGFYNWCRIEKRQGVGKSK